MLGKRNDNRIKWSSQVLPGHREGLLFGVHSVKHSGNAKTLIQNFIAFHCIFISHPTVCWLLFHITHLILEITHD